MEMLNGVGSRTMSKDIFTTHYYGPNSEYSLIPKGAPFNDASRGLKPSFSFSNLCTVQKWGTQKGGLTEHQITPYFVPGGYIISDGKTVFMPIADLTYDGKVTLTPVEDVFNPGDPSDRMAGWLAIKPLIEYVIKPTGKSGLYEGPEFTPDYSRHSAMTKVNVPIKRWSGVNMDINKVGVGFSQIQNTWQDLRDVIFVDYPKRPGYNPETLEILISLLEDGFGPTRGIDAIGVEDLKREIAGTYPKNGTATLVSSKDIYDEALAIAQAYGLEGEEAIKSVKRAIWYHELYHVSDQRKGLSEKEIETGIGEFLAKFFGSRASIVNEKLAGYYRALARYNKDYAQGYREGRIKSSKSLNSRIESLIKQYTSEAKDMELEGEEAKEYVASRLEAELEGESENPEAEYNSAKASSDKGKAETDAEDSGNKSSDNYEACSEGAESDGSDGGPDGCSGEAAE